MAKFVIEGGHQLHGEITPQGAKNEALEVICATVLSKEAVTISNVPNILDVNNLIQLMMDMGIYVRKEGNNTYTFKAEHINEDYLHSEDFKERCTALRGSVLLVGPLLARLGYAIIPKPGGDKIGRRRLDTHFTGIQKLGATFAYDNENQLFNVTAKELKGCYMLLDETRTLYFFIFRKMFFFIN